MFGVIDELSGVALEEDVRGVERLRELVCGYELARGDISVIVPVAVSAYKAAKLTEAFPRVRFASVELRDAVGGELMVERVIGLELMRDALAPVADGVVVAGESTLSVMLKPKRPVVFEVVPNQECDGGYEYAQFLNSAGRGFVSTAAASLSVRDRGTMAADSWARIEDVSRTWCDARGFATQMYRQQAAFGCVMVPRRLSYAESRAGWTDVTTMLGGRSPRADEVLASWTEAAYGYPVYVAGESYYVRSVCAVGSYTYYFVALQSVVECVFAGDAAARAAPDVVTSGVAGCGEVGSLGLREPSVGGFGANPFVEAAGVPLSALMKPVAVVADEVVRGCCSGYSGFDPPMTAEGEGSAGSLRDSLGVRVFASWSPDDVELLRATLLRLECAQAFGGFTPTGVGSIDMGLVSLYRGYDGGGHCGRPSSRDYAAAKVLLRFYSGLHAIVFDRWFGLIDGVSDAGGGRTALERRVTEWLKVPVRRSYSKWRIRLDYLCRARLLRGLGFSGPRMRAWFGVGIQEVSVEGIEMFVAGAVSAWVAEGKPDDVAVYGSDGFGGDTGECVCEDCMSGDCVCASTEQDEADNELAGHSVDDGEWQVLGSEIPVG